MFEAKSRRYKEVKAHAVKKESVFDKIVLPATAL